MSPVEIGAILDASFLGLVGLIFLADAVYRWAKRDPEAAE
jgi:hypothetical protein